MSLFKITEKFVLNKLKNISQGNLILINYDGKVFHFGDLESKLSSDIKINNPNFGIYFSKAFKVSIPNQGFIVIASHG